VDSFDWDRHWKREEEPRDAKAFAETMAQRIMDFMDGKKIESIADFGCGPASMLFVLAERCLGVRLHGYDVSESIIKRNEAKTRELGLNNLSFSRDELPSPDSRRRHDLVTCFSTLHYIRDTRKAVKTLYGMVDDGGWLIFNYPSRLTRSQMRKEIAPDDDSMNRRFRLVLEGENLLTMKQIEELLGVRPGKFYSSKRYNIYVKIRKPLSTKTNE
jgi:trans-aconitate methyltransferase